MCTSVATDGSARVRSGGERIVRFTDQVRVELICYNYIVYSRLGSNLEEGFLSFVSRIIGGSTHDFYYVEPQSPNNLLSLFNTNRISDLPSQFRQMTSAISGKWVYFYIEGRRGQSDELIEVDYHNSNNWDAAYYRFDPCGEFIPYRGESSSTEFFCLSRSKLPYTRAISLPNKISPSTASHLFMGRGVFDRGLSATRNFSLVQPVTSPQMASGVEFQIVVFDPGNIISHSAEVIKYSSRLLQIMDPRNRFSRLSSYEQEIRTKGILLTLIKELVERDSSLRNDVNRSLLNNDYNRYVNLGYRKGLFIDNLYNFLNHDIITRLEEVLMIYKEDNIPVDGLVWLDIISSIAELAGEHDLLIYYFQAASEKETDKNAFSTFYRSSLDRNQHQTSRIVSVWQNLLGSQKYAKLLLSIAEVRVYYLVDSYTKGDITWQRFNELLQNNSDELKNLPSSLRSGAGIVQALRRIDALFTWAKRAGTAAAILKGDFSASTFSAVLTSLSDFMKSRNLAVGAARVILIKNLVDVVSNTVNLTERLRMEDYDAALGYGLVIAAGVPNIASIIITGTTLGGPVGAVLSIAAVTGSIIIIFATDSDTESFMQNTSWGANPYQSAARPDWAVCRFNQFSDSRIGLNRQLVSLLNLLHKLESVKDKYDNITKVIGIEINTKFFPDTSVFSLKLELNSSRRGRCRAKLNLTFPSRDRRGYQTFTPTVSGTRLVRGINARVESESGIHTIKINIGLTENVEQGELWLTCYPFGHSEFSVPHEKAVYLENCTESRIFFRSHDFEPNEWRPMPSW